MYDRCYLKDLAFALDKEPQYFIIKKNKCTVIYICSCVFSESFRRELKEAETVYISEYYLICRFVIMTLRLHLKFRVTC